MAYTINLGNRNIKFLAGKNYKVGESLIISVAFSIQCHGFVNGNFVSTKIQEGNFSVISGTTTQLNFDPVTIYLETDSVGFVAQVESNIATLAARDVEIAKRLLEESNRIYALEAATDGKAVIDDTSTGTDKVLSASKTLALISTAKTELEAFANSAASGIIDDTSTGTDKVLSASKIAALLNALDNAAKNYASAAKSDLLNGADGAYDTLKEIQTFLEENAGVLTALEQAGLNKVSFTELQSLSPEQKQTARTNIGAITAAEATTITNDRIGTVVGDPSTLSTAAIFATFLNPLV